MKKLRLDLDGLTVDSFSTAVEAVERDVQPTLKTLCGSTWLESNPTCCPCTPRHEEI